MNYMSGDIQLSAIKLTNLNGDRTADISGQVLEINIYEDITSPVITGQILIEDGINLLSQFPIIGEEQVTFSLQTPNASNTNQVVLNVSGVSDSLLQTNMKSRCYWLNLVSPEFYNSKKQVITQRYQDSTSNIIKSVLTDKLQTKKTFDIEATSGIETLNLDRLAPFAAIDFLRRRSISSKYQSSSFCFFENKDGYHLNTLEGIFDKKKGSIGNKIFFYNNNVNYDTTVVTIRDIIAHDHVSLVNTPDTITGTRVTTFDIVSGDVKVTDYPDSTSQTIDSNGQNINTSNFNSKYKANTVHTCVVPIDASLPRPPIDQKIGHIQPLIARLTANLLHLHVYGDTDIAVGDVIEVRLPDVNGGTNPSSTDRLYSGNYLIAKLRHMIEVSPRPYHTMSFELMKGSYLDNA